MAPNLSIVRRERAPWRVDNAVARTCAKTPDCDRQQILLVKALDIGVKCELRHFWQSGVRSANDLDMWRMPDICADGTRRLSALSPKVLSKVVRPAKTLQAQV